MFQNWNMKIIQPVFFFFISQTCSDQDGFSIPNPNNNPVMILCCITLITFNLNLSFCALLHRSVFRCLISFLPASLPLLSSSLPPSLSFPLHSLTPCWWWRSWTQQYLLLQTPLMFTEQMQQDVIMVLKFPSNSPVTHVAANTQSGLTNPAVITVTANRLFAVNKWHGLTGEQDRL